MRALRVVGITEGGGELSVVLEDSARQERFTVPADEQLRAAARGDLTRLGQIAIELESQLRPREIQARIRAGASVDQVAAAAGVPQPEDRAVRVPGAAGAVAHGRGRPARAPDAGGRAGHPDAGRRRRAHLRPARAGVHSAEWDSWKGDDGRGSSRSPGGRGARTTARCWAFQPGAHGGTVTAIDEHAHDLVEGLPARPLRTVGPVIDISRPDERRHPRLKRGTSCGRPRRTSRRAGTCPTGRASLPSHAARNRGARPRGPSPAMCPTASRNVRSGGRRARHRLARFPAAARVRPPQQ